MKNLPCYIILATFVSLVLLMAVASFRISLPFIDIASLIIGYAATAAILAVAFTDGAPRSARTSVKAAEAESTREAVPARPHRATRRAPAGSVPGGVLATLGVVNDPATVSLM